MQRRLRVRLRRLGGHAGRLSWIQTPTAVNFVTVKTLIFSFKMKIFKPTLKTYLSHQLFGITKS